jgi:hypothetical protein
MCLEENYELALIVISVVDVFLVLLIVVSAIAFHRQNKEMEADFKAKREMNNRLNK